MPHASHPDAMQPARPGPTRTAPPLMPASYPLGGRYRGYIIFGGCSIFFVLQALLVLRAVNALAAGPQAWEAMLADFANPLYLAYHALALLAIVYTGYRFLLKLFGKAQPPRIGPLPRPPVEAFPPLLSLVWLGATALFLAVLLGVIP